MAISSADLAELKIIATHLGVPVEWLQMELTFESRLNPQAKNPKSTARGIMQWTDARARDLGYQDSADLVAQNPAFRDQLGIVEKDLSRYMPFPTFQSLAMAVFLPSMRYAAPDTTLPTKYQALNQGIRTVADYVAKATKAGGGTLAIVETVGAGTLFFGLALAYLIIKKRGT
jgi:hypothetical protein